ncbi:MAG TPA: PDR/VanB family oxidoreductase, partial [Hyphomicrobiales bacterium]|nr:PDR/VanB family oxidoreductase [Hyphomicrobiales bacterium]
MNGEESSSDLFPAVIAAKSEIAAGIFGFELRDPSHAELPEFTPGAHLSVRVPNGFIRKYSLCNSASERDRYLIAVKKEADGRGGSASLVDESKAGDTLLISAPRNDFPLVESRGGYIFIAGGIGITPIMSMIRTLQQGGRRFRLYYCTRSPEETAFAEELAAPELKSRILIHHDGGDPARFLDLWPILERPQGQHVYCCGPRPLMDAVRDMTGHWPSSAIHFESFADAAPVKPDDREFFVRIAGSDKVIPVPPGTTILQALRREGYKTVSSCESGSCGTCRTRLIAGEPDHRDLVLSEAQRGRFIMICVS